MMKVLQINANLDFGSTGVIMQDIGARAVADGIDMYYAYQNARSPKQNAIKVGNNISWLIHAFMCRLFGMQAFFSVFSTLALLRKISVIHPDIVHLHNLHNNYINIPILLKYLAKNDIRTIITMHDCWWFTGKCTHYVDIGCNRFQKGCHDCPKRMKDIPAILYDSSNYIWRKKKELLKRIPRLTLVGCSEWICNEARKSVLRNCNIRHIYNGFDLDVFKPTPSDIAKKLGLEGKRILLGPASKWLSEVNKNTLDYFIKYMPKDSVLVLFGAKEHNNKYLAYNVLLYGYTRSREEMAQLYSMADIFVNCSREDTLSSLNLEAQACGTPVVTYEATGNKETVCNGYGHAVETGNAKALFAATEQVLAQGKESYSTPCINWVKSNFDKQTNYEKYIRLYREIVG